MINITGSNYTEIGSLQENLVLNTAGKLKVRYGNKMIDLLNLNGEPYLSDIVADLEKRIKLLEAEVFPQPTETPTEEIPTEELDN